MPKFDLPIAAIMGDPYLSLTSSPFAPGKVIVKRASFKKGEVPAHLKGYLITSGMCSNEMGTVIYKGKKVPKVAACVARKKGR
jgi:hypothetical protein